MFSGDGAAAVTLSMCCSASRGAAVPLGGRPGCLGRRRGQTGRRPTEAGGGGEEDPKQAVLLWRKVNSPGGETCPYGRHVRTDMSTGRSLGGNSQSHRKCFLGWKVPLKCATVLPVCRIIKVEVK